jgi:hypothetical protein
LSLARFSRRLPANQFRTDISDNVKVRQQVVCSSFAKMDFVLKKHTLITYTLIYPTGKWARCNDFGVNQDSTVSQVLDALLADHPSCKLAQIVWEEYEGVIWLDELLNKADTEVADRRYVCNFQRQSEDMQPVSVHINIGR